MAESKSARKVIPPPAWHVAWSRSCQVVGSQPATLDGGVRRADRAPHLPLPTLAGREGFGVGGPLRPARGPRARSGSPHRPHCQRAEFVWPRELLLPGPVSRMKCMFRLFPGGPPDPPTRRRAGRKGPLRGHHDLSYPQIPPTGHFTRTKPPISLPTAYTDRLFAGFLLDIKLPETGPGWGGVAWRGPAPGRRLGAAE